MLQETVSRLLPAFPVSDIFISTNEIYQKEVGEELPDIPPGNIIVEPAFRERASSVALAAAVIAGKRNEDTMAVLPSDHYIKNADKLIHVLREAEKFLKRHPDYLVTVGAKPTNPEIGYGYIKSKESKAWTAAGDMAFGEAEKFIEKPDSKTAQSFFGSGNFFWNTSIYIWKTSAIIDRFKKFIPDTYERFCRIRDAVGTSRFKEVLNKEYPLMDMVSVEYGVLENDDKIAVISDDLGWSDIGSWSVLKDSLTGGSDSHCVKGEHLDIGSKNLLVYGSKKLISTVGLKDLIIVDTDDVVLVCDKNNTQLVKSIVEELEKSGRIKLL